MPNLGPISLSVAKRSSYSQPRAFVCTFSSLALDPPSALLKLTVFGHVLTCFGVCIRAALERAPRLLASSLHINRNSDKQTCLRLPHPHRITWVACSCAYVFRRLRTFSKSPLDFTLTKHLPLRLGSDTSISCSYRSSEFSSFSH
jgi:hypothetical protein